MHKYNFKFILTEYRNIVFHKLIYILYNTYYIIHILYNTYNYIYVYIQDIMYIAK